MLARFVLYIHQPLLSRGLPSQLTLLVNQFVHIYIGQPPILWLAFFFLLPNPSLSVLSLNFRCILFSIHIISYIYLSLLVSVALTLTCRALICIGVIAKSHDIRLSIYLRRIMLIER